MRSPTRKVSPGSTAMTPCSSERRATRLLRPRTCPWPAPEGRSGSLESVFEPASQTARSDAGTLTQIGRAVQGLTLNETRHALRLGGDTQESLMALTVESIRRKKPAADRRTLTVGSARGLYLVVEPSGTKRFLLRYKVAGTTHRHTLGTFGDEAASFAELNRFMAGK